MSESRLGYDGDEGIYFDRTKPAGQECEERGQLYEECDPVEVCGDLEADNGRLREAMKDAAHILRCLTVQAAVAVADTLDAALTTEPTGSDDNG